MRPNNSPPPVKEPINSDEKRKPKGRDLSEARKQFVTVQTP